MSTTAFVLIAFLIGADPVTPADTALAKVPADIEYFSSTLRFGETFTAISNSQAWKTISSDPGVKSLHGKALESLSNPQFAPVVKFFMDPANAAIPELAADACSKEIFLATGAGTGKSMALLQDLIGVAQFGPAFAQLQGGNAGIEERAHMLLSVLAEKPDRVRGPDVMIGFKVSDPVAVTAQLKRLDPVLKDLLKDSPLQDRIERVKIDEDDFLTLSLDGNMVPWDTIPFHRIEEEDGEFKPLVKHLKSLKLHVAIGVRQGYLLIVLGRDAESVRQFGAAGPRLMSRKEFAPVVKAAGKPLLSCNYTSAALRQAIATTEEDIEGTAEMVKGMLPLARLNDELIERIESDIDTIAKSFIAELVKPEATLDYSIRTQNGWETFAYDYTPVDGVSTKPLTILNHLGGRPVLALASRTDYQLKDHQSMVKWISKFAGYAEAITREKIPDSEDYWDRIRKDLYPLIKELNTITETKIYPALADSQSAIVIDGKWSSPQWHRDLPGTSKPMPLPEIGIVVGVSDGSMLIDGLEGYRTTMNRLYAKVRTMVPDNKLPEFEISIPNVEKVNGKTFAWYPIPKQWGVDTQLQPTGGLSERVAALALSRGHVERLLAPTPLAASLTPITRDKLIDSAMIFSGKELAEMMRPWLGVIVEQSREADRADVQRIGQSVVSLLGVVEHYGTVTYREKGITITHSEGIYRDFPVAKP
jgi:hypothetical protein